MITNWKAIATGSYSMWGLYILIFVEGGVRALAAIAPEMEPSVEVQSIAVIVLAALTAIGRVLSQPNLEH